MTKRNLKIQPFEDLGFAKIDHHRHLRKGFPEVIYCEGKTAPQIIKIARCMLKKKHNVLATRASEKVYKAVKKSIAKAKFNKTAKIITIQATKPKKLKGDLLIVTAGTSDIPVAEEAAITANFLGIKVKQLFDVGVAGIHRLLKHIKALHDADVIIVVAGMEGALASVIGGLVGKPIIAVPTSVGYGASFKGIAPLLTMLNCCAPGVSVVNIDNGFGAACVAFSILNLTHEKRK
ncbi:MAG: nickel pincer cofactor biosynthesis protein LarB [Candidatus Margulisbacteria bacterium]|nr:nickel pincer cofactor biosynthesis protein LarB [Candidatus Margulisiibacteriota bacterium]MBU1021428.1 nickel pincer cofactor biosynthesis protein LarB [Candidatus Margulisiibacteriota bacterium]MBU1728349.1 nickel pincer cofactor biosynthesis protein LarB [Candidatus Margulisiibacteriota bacterium]MBU1955908.1 nickel pincer cofactor biosynthesis protein LarB [Candidatus Margulisiibacteriota bacterium]